MTRARAGIAAISLEPRVVWILASPRSGTTWLMALLAKTTGGHVIDEPLIGAHLAVPVGAILAVPERDRLVFDANRSRRPYFFSDATSDVWGPALRSLLLRRFAAETATGLRSRDLVFVKEPNGSMAAELLVGTLPRSRLLFVVRDGRDVVDSMLDGIEGGWITGVHGVSVGADRRRDFMTARARAWVQTVEAVQAAYDAHLPERRCLVTYEALRAEPERELTRILTWLGREDAIGRVDETVAELSFERQPTERRGPGRFARAATPGLWRERFSTDEALLLNGVMGPALKALGYPDAGEP